MSLTALNTPPSLISGFDVVSALIPTSRSAPEIPLSQLETVSGLSIIGKVFIVAKVLRPHEDPP